jgi:hypothetical protein
MLRNLLFFIFLPAISCKNNEINLNKETAHVDSLAANQYHPTDTLSYTSLAVETFYNGATTAMATAFIGLYHNKTFLITNYHVLAGREASDTTVIKNPNGYIPNTISIHLITNWPRIDSIKANLLTSSGKRLFFTMPVGFNEKNIRYSIPDVAILPINIPEGIMFKPINLESLKADWTIKPSTPIRIYGFAEGWNRKSIRRPDIINAISLNSRSFDDSDLHIIFNYNGDLEGVSGGPAFIFDNGNPIFIGIHHAQLEKINPTTFAILPSSWIIA